MYVFELKNKIPVPWCDCVAVSGIKKKQLSEVRSMANPPAIVKTALESICLLLDVTEDNDVIPDWKTIRSILNKDSFIPSILNFDTASLTYDIHIQKKTYKATQFTSTFDPFANARLTCFSSFNKIFV